MKTKRYWFYEDEKYALLKDLKEGAYVYSKNNNKYYFEDLENADKLAPNSAATPLNFGALDFLINTILGAILIFFAFTVYSVIPYARDFSFSTITPFLVLIAVLFLIANLFLHELSHVFIFRLFGGKTPKIKFSISIKGLRASSDSSEAYLMPKYRRFAIFFAGTAANLLCCALFLITLPSMFAAVVPVLVLTFINILPSSVTKNDGYNILKFVISNPKRIGA